MPHAVFFRVDLVNFGGVLIFLKRYTFEGFAIAPEGFDSVVVVSGSEMLTKSDYLYSIRIIRICPIIVCVVVVNTTSD